MRYHTADPGADNDKGNITIGFYFSFCINKNNNNFITITTIIEVKKCITYNNVEPCYWPQCHRL